MEEMRDFLFYLLFKKIRKRRMENTMEYSSLNPDGYPYVMIPNFGQIRREMSDILNLLHLKMDVSQFSVDQPIFLEFGHWWFHCLFFRYHTKLRFNYFFRFI